MAELEIKEPGGDGRAGAANVVFQTAFLFPTWSAGSNQGREGWVHAGRLCSVQRAGQRGPAGSPQNSAVPGYPHKALLHSLATLVWLQGTEMCLVASCLALASSSA